MGHHDIKIPANGNPTSQSASERDTIQWSNRSRRTAHLILPACFGPQTAPLPIAAGGTSMAYAVQDGTGSGDPSAPNSYPYIVLVEDSVRHKRGEFSICSQRTGTIDVS